jgi:hypothetical protein
MKAVNIVTRTLVTIGAINWGLVGLFKFNLVKKIFGSHRTPKRIVYGLVGLSGAYQIKNLARGGGSA